MHGAIRTYGNGLAAVEVVRPGAEAGLARAVEGLRAATTRPLRVVVADSRCGGTPLAAPDAEVLRLGEDVGAAAAVNRAIAGLGPDVGWVVAGWAGAVWAAGAVDTLLAVAADLPRAGVLGPAVPDHVPPAGWGAGAPAALLRPNDPWPPPRRSDRAVETSDSRWRKVRLALPKGATRAAETCDTRGVGIAEGAVLLRRVAFDSVDGFDPRYPSLAVLDLARRLERAGWLVVPVPDAVVDGAVEGPPGRHAEVRGYLAERNRGFLRAPLRAALRVTAAPG